MVKQNLQQNETKNEKYIIKKVEIPLSHILLPSFL